MNTRGRAYFVALLLVFVPLHIATPEKAVAAPLLPPGFTTAPIATGQGEFNLTDFTFLPGGGMLTAGKNGRVTYVAPNGAINVVGQVAVDNVGDLGLLGIGIGVDFPHTGYLYATYEYQRMGKTFSRLSQFTVDNPATPTALASESVILDGIEHFEVVHGMGRVIVDSDGTIWFAMGDASPFSYNSPESLRTQDLNEPYGKLFHINANGSGVPDNPFYDATNPLSWRSRIWASGLRNPFRFSLAADGTPYIGDVGANKIEEVNIGRKGANYGWPCYEGRAQKSGFTTAPVCQGLYARNDATFSLYEYSHTIGRSITGGIHAYGDAYPEPYRNAWFFGDYTASKIWTLETTGSHELAQAPEMAVDASSAFGSEIGGPVSFRLSPTGEVHYADIYTGNVVALRYATGNRAPVAKASAQTTYGNTTVSFSGGESYDPDGDVLTYDWDFGDGSAHSSQANPVHTYPTAQTYTATLVVTDPHGARTTATVLAPIDNHPPSLTVVGPPEGHRFAVDEPLAFAATASDAEDSDINATDVAWRVDLIHCTGVDECHTHPGRTSTGPEFQLVYPDHGGDTHLVVRAAVRDTVGHVTTWSYAALPQLHELTVTSSINGPVTVNGTELPTGGTVTVVANSRNVVVAPGAIAQYAFDVWSDASTDRQRMFTMPPANSSLHATYRTVGLDATADSTGTDGRINLTVSPRGRPGDQFHSPWSGDCRMNPPVNDDGDGVLSFGETWTIPCTVVAGTYPGPFVADVVMVGPQDSEPSTKSEALWLNPGYRMVASDGGIFSFGNAPFFGSTGGWALNAPVVGMATATSGYWMVAADGGIFAFNAPFFGSMGGRPLNKPIVGMAPTPSGNGYWLVASDGGIFTFGDAPFLGSTGGQRLNQPIVGMSPTPTGNGYWLVASDGGVFTFGDAEFLGSTGGQRLNKPILGMAPTPWGNGYWLVASDGGIFAFGAAAFLGSTGGQALNQPVVGMAPTPSGKGYRLVASDGGIFTFGDAGFLGSMGGTPLNRAVLGVAGTLAP
ncbi:MAG TPA: PQQ-dependent sugar dehydrogenase [Acidimicrobiales bacterium]|nr:PQQ-dependent sugar dehydrogenase [Acidimicrobiales bacterium]